MISTAAYYVFIASAVLVYGIGLNTVALTLDSMRVVCISLFSIFLLIDFVIKIKNKGKEFEFSVSFLILILTVNECISLTDLIIAVISCSASFLVLLYLIRAVRNRLNIAESSAMNKNLKTLLLLSIAILIAVLAAANVSWLNAM